MGCIPCTNLQPEVAHLNACYPPYKALLTAGPEYRPLAQDLSKLTYFATNKPSKLAKIGEELERRVEKEAQKSTGGYQKSRASLLISLAILRALLTECKRDIALFARSVLRVIERSLEVRVYQRGGMDLEVIGRAAAGFIAFTTYTDGSAIGVDDSLTKSYLNILRKFGTMATETNADASEKPDLEQQSRTRLIALAALNGAATSDAMFSSTREFPRQVGLILPPLLANLFEGPMEQLKLETERIDMDASPSPFFSEFSARPPVADRKAASLHAHIPGEKGPSAEDVQSAALRSLHALVQQCQVAQASHIVDLTGVFLDKHGWQDVERCCWLAERLTAWIVLQYRFVVPTRLVEVLVDLRDDQPSAKHTSALAMVTAILNSTTSLVGLGVSDLLQNLVSIIIGRLHFDTRDALLPPLVQCVSSLGTHIYYADQINDIVEELAIRIAEINPLDKSRSEIVRVLICCITGVMVVADAGDDEAEHKLTITISNTSNVNAGTPSAAPTSTTSPDKGKAPALPVETSLLVPMEQHHPRRSSRRNPISPDVWQETLPLLCEANYAVRSAYARALLLFLETEMPRSALPGRAATGARPGAADTAITRYCHALHAAVYTLVMSSCLGAEHDQDVVSTVTTARQSPEAAIHSLLTTTTTAPASETEGSKDTREKDQGSGRGTPGGEKGVSFNLHEPDSPTIATATTASVGSGLSKVTRGRRASLPLNRLQSYVNLQSFDNVATPLDFAAALRILDELHSVVPVQALVTGVPMLLALDKDAGNELVRRPGDGRAGAWVLERKRAIREMVALVWRRIGERWGVADVEQLAAKTVASLPEPFSIPPYPSRPPILLPTPEDPLSFVQHTVEGESSSTAKPLLDPEAIVASLATAPLVQGATKKDSEALTRALGARWTVEKAIKDSIERYSSANLKYDDDTHYTAASALLMNLNNASYQSDNGQRGSRAIDVTDLRDALGGRVDGDTSGAPSINSTIEDRQSSGYIRAGGTLQQRKAKNEDVREVLKDIFKDKNRASAAARGGAGALSDGTGSGAGVGEKDNELGVTGVAAGGPLLGPKVAA